MTVSVKALVRIAVAVVILTGAGLLTGSTQPADASILRVPISECNLHCDHCQTGGHWTHFWMNGGAGGILHGECFPGGCEVHGCDPEDDDNLNAGGLAGAVEALATSSPADLPNLIDRYPKFLLLNRSRAAIQVLDCQGNVWAHVPLGEVSLRTLE
jgi:hypothetical protein